MKDPTKTLTIRSQASREIDVRFNRLKRVIRETLNQAEGLIANIESISDGRFIFLRDPEKLDEFNEWFKEQVDEEILAGGAEDNWLNAYVGQGYDRGARKTRLAAERNIPSLNKLEDFSPLANPAHVERAELIYTRVYKDLEGVTESMSSAISRELASGILTGENPRTVAARLNKQVDNIGKNRAKLIARTEIVHAHNTASIQEGSLIAAETGVEEQYQWLTAIDGRERPAHHDRHENIYPGGEAQSLLGEPNCRCSVSFYFDVEKVLAGDSGAGARTQKPEIIEKTAVHETLQKELGVISSEGALRIQEESALLDDLARSGQFSQVLPEIEHDFSLAASEHNVRFSESGEVVNKSTKPRTWGFKPIFNDEGEVSFSPAGPSDYLKRVALTNSNFNTRIEVKGITPRSGGIVTSQPFFSGDQPSQEQVEDYLKSLGFIKQTKIAESVPDLLADSSFYNPDTSTLLLDVRGENARLVDGEVQLFDVMINRIDK